jgi:hypothetical protein
MNEALTALISDESCPSSQLKVSLDRLQDNRMLQGVTRDHFENVHKLLESTSWTSYSEQWEEKVDYIARANRSDACSDLVAVSYGERDAMNVKCQRETVVGTPVYMTAATPMGEPLLLRAVRVKRDDAMPPEPKSRYTTVCIQKFRDFVRTSASVKEVSTTFRLTVMWKAHCLRDAYSAHPIYLIEVIMNRDAGNLMTDEAMMKTSSEMESLHRWMTANLKAKVGDVCLTQNVQLQLCDPENSGGKLPHGRTCSNEQNSKKRKLQDGGSSYAASSQIWMDSTNELCHEEPADDLAECFDNDDDECCPEDYM